MMGKSNHEDFRAELTKDHGVGEAPEQQAFDSTNTGNTGSGGQRDDVLFKQIERRINSVL